MRSTSQEWDLNRDCYSDQLQTMVELGSHCPCKKKGKKVNET